MFEPFSRGNEESSGFGLGLAIAKRGVAIHGGTIAASNREGGGLVVRLCIPVTESRFPNRVQSELEGPL
ncbi:MAG: ATP-binding protein [Sphingopyxis sp.]